MSEKPIVYLVRTGVANLGSITAGVARAGGSPVITEDSSLIASAPLAIVPGVGSFGQAMQGVNATPGLLEALQIRIKAGLPTMFVCVGLQILAKASEESVGAEGLGLLDTTVIHFPTGVHVPQQGWNLVVANQSNYITSGYAYFSNSYCVPEIPDAAGWNVSLCKHGIQFAAAFEFGALLACQFHPELSGEWGLKIMSNWIAKSPSLIRPVEFGVTFKPMTASPGLPAKTGLTRRIIPCLDVRGGKVVKGIKFQNLQEAGSPADRSFEYQQQGADELVMLDVSATIEERKTAHETIREIRKGLCIPLTVGGGVKHVDDAQVILEAGADKVSVNTAAVRDPSILTAMATKFGRQCTVLAIDAIQSGPDTWEVVVSSGKEKTGKNVVEWAIEGVEKGAGEILLTSWDRDGTKSGYDLDLLRRVSAAVQVPVIASGGAANAGHLSEAMGAGADAVLAASIFHYGEYTVGTLKDELKQKHQMRVAVPAPPKTTVKESPNAIIPSIDLMNGHAVQLVGGKTDKMKVDAGDPVPIAEQFRIAGEIAVVDLDAALGKGNNVDVIKRLIKVAKCRVGGGIRDVETALMWLNAGATKVVLGTAAKPEILSQLPRERVVAALDADKGEVVVKGWTTKTGRSVFECIDEIKQYVGGFLVTFVEREGRMGGIDQDYLDAIKKLKAACGDNVELTIAGGVTTVEEIAMLDKLGVHAPVGMALYTHSMDLGEAIAAPLLSDRPDGLISTVVVNERRQLLGLVYSSRESIKEAVKRKKGIYQSRKRGLWFKGETSGATQDLLQILPDCDRDAVCFVVHQHGDGFCHLNRFSCFETEIGLSHLSKTLEERKQNAPAGSYTRRLFNDDALLNAKILEEAKELVDATDKDEITWEAADVIYFALVKAYKHGITLDDIEAELDKRSLKVTRRQGDAKPQFLSAVTSSTTSTQASEDSNKNFVREDLRTIDKYVGVKPLEVLADEIGIDLDEIVKLDANENLYGSPKEYMEAIEKSFLHIYPDPTQVLLRKDIANYVGVDDSQVVAGAGSDDMIDIILRLARPGPVIISTPTFGMYSYLSKIVQLPVVDVPRGPPPAFETPIDAIIETIRNQKASVVFIVSPNNPTGFVVPNDQIERVAKENCLVVVDEAYAEFSKVSAVDLINQYPNLIILRTFSKWAGLAGLRAGFSVSHETIANVMLSIKQPYNINVAADHAARAALSLRPVIQKQIDAILEERKIMQLELAKFEHLEPLRSDANFFLCKVTGGPLGAKEIWAGLRKLGVFLRYFEKPAFMSDYIRVSVGRPKDTEALLRALRIVMGSTIAKTPIVARALPLKGIIFDMDGVLADESASYREAIVRTAGSYGIIVDSHYVTSFKAKGASNNDWVCCQQILQEHGVTADLSEVTKRFEEFYQGNETTPGLWEVETLIPTKSLMRHLASIVPLAIVTGRPRRDAERFLAQHGIAEHFVHLVCMEDAPSKPDPAPVHIALKAIATKLSIQPPALIGRVVMIGDTPNDILAAKAAGIIGIGIPAPKEAGNPDVLKSFSESGANYVLSHIQELRLLVT